MKRIIGILVLFLSLAVVAGAAPKKLTFYWISHGSAGYPIWVYAINGANAAAQALGVNVRTSFHNNDVASQKEAFSAAIAAKADGIATSSPQDGALKDEVALAKSKGIPVVFLNTDDPSTGRDAFVGANLFQAGFQWAKYLVDHKYVKRGDRVWMPVEVPGATYQTEETRGIASVFDPLGVKYEIFDAGTDPATMISRMTDYAASHGNEIAAMIGLGDNVAGATEQVFKAVNWKPGQDPCRGVGQLRGNGPGRPGRLRERSLLAVPGLPGVHADRAAVHDQEQHGHRVRYRDPCPLRQEQRRDVSRPGEKNEVELAEEGSRRSLSPAPPIPTTEHHPLGASDMGSFFSTFFEKYKTTKELWSLTLLILLSALFYIIDPAFLSALNISNFFAYFPELGIMALSMTYLLIAGEFDLSIGALFAFAPVMMFALRNNLGVPIEWAWLISIILSAFFGFMNGIFVTKVRISSFLATLGMMLIVRGIALFVANAFPQSQWSTDSPLKTVLAGSYKFGDFSVYNSFIWFISSSSSCCTSCA